MLTEDRKSRIKWRCRRGMLELDLLFEKYLKHNLDNMSNDECIEFEQFLTNTDPDLYAWLMGYATPIDALSIKYVNNIRAINKI